MVESLGVSSNETLIALGANLDSLHGGPKATLRQALKRLEGLNLGVASLSRWWRTPAFPVGSGPDFVNAVAALETTLDPTDLLAALHSVEEALGRARTSRWAARVVDLDLLAQGDSVAPDSATVQRWMAMAPDEAQSQTPDRLLLPHPRLHERAFVLAPLVDVRPDWRHPLLGASARELFAALPAEAMRGVSPLDDGGA